MLLFFVVVGSPLFLLFDEVNRHVYVTAYSFSGICIFLWNFPKIPRSFHGRHLNIGDLIVAIQDTNDPEEFLRRWDAVMTVCISLLVVAFANYLKWKLEVSLLEAAFIVFSTSGTFYSVQQKIGGQALKYYYKLKKEDFGSTIVYQPQRDLEMQTFKTSEPASYVQCPSTSNTSQSTIDID
jgi:hypothetical protein